MSTKAGYAQYFPLCSYNEALVESGLTKLSDRCQELVDNLFKEALQNERNKFHELLQFLRRTGFATVLLLLMPLRP